VVISAHYDSRAASSTSPTQRAPGANDNGSGTTTLLQIAKIIHSSDINFLRTVHIVGFSGEEQGLYQTQIPTRTLHSHYNGWWLFFILGSQAYAKKLVAEGANVVALLNADIAYVFVFWWV
jgi:hypothetical protein